MPHSPKHHLRMQIKQLGADGSFEGLLAVYNNVDLGGDVILAGAFTKTLQEHGSQVPLLWQHKTDEPIGTLTLTDASDALHCKGQLLMDLPTAQKAYLLLKSKIISGLSIGYDTIKDTVDNNVRYLKELRLWEGSVVTFPMNPEAMVQAIKSLRDETKGDFDAELANQQIQDAGYQIFNALYAALMSLTWASDLSKEDTLSAAQTILDQFTAAYMAYLPDFYDYINAEYGSMETMSRKRMKVKALRVVSMITKEGRELSTANLQKIAKAHDHAKAIGGHVDDMKSIFQTLLPDEAALESEVEDVDPDPDADDPDNSTSSAKAAKEKTEPDTTHSAEIKTVDSILALIPKAS
jgi:HK97 family phage prohead protease